MENIIGYTMVEKILDDIIEETKWVKSANYTYFNKETDKNLEEYIKYVKDLKVSIEKFYETFDDLLLENEEKCYEKWKKEQAEIEKEFYGETQYGKVND